MDKEAKFGLRSVDVHFGMFDFGLKCIVGPYANVEKYIAWKFEDPGYSINNAYVPRGRIFYRDGYVPVIWLPRRPVTAREHGTLSHEVLHAVVRLMDWAGIKFSAETEEAWCHAVGFAVTEIIEKLGRK